MIKPLNFSQGIKFNLSKEAFYQIFGPYINKDLARNIKQLHKFKKQENKKGEALRQLKISLIYFSKKWQLNINLDIVMFAVYNTAMNAMDLLASDFIFYDRNKYFVEMFQKQLSMLYPELKQMTREFCHTLSLTINDTLINYLLFTLLLIGVIW